MSQHLIKEVQQLKYEVAQLKEASEQGATQETARIWDYLKELRDRLDALDRKVDVIVERLPAPPGSEPIGPGSYKVGEAGFKTYPSADQPSSGAPRGARG
jgi:hypothetical protein